MTTLAPAKASPSPLTRGAGPAFSRAQSLAGQVADFIVDGIASGAYAFGQRLIETDLARQLDVSRVPIREALKMLEAQGILVVTPHRGAHVAEFDSLKSDRVREARIALERLEIAAGETRAAKMLGDEAFVRVVKAAKPEDTDRATLDVAIGWYEKAVEVEPAPDAKAQAEQSLAMLSDLKQKLSR